MHSTVQWDMASVMMPSDAVTSDLSTSTQCGRLSLSKAEVSKVNWVAVKELKLSYYIGETLPFTIHTHYGNLI